MCGACYSSCQVIALTKKYIGPHALLKAFLRVMDPRDSAPRARLDDLDQGDGVYRCHTIFNCIDACPKTPEPDRRDRDAAQAGDEARRVRRGARRPSGAARPADPGCRGHGVHVRR